jgi:hypothetical protein
MSLCVKYYINNLVTEFKNLAGPYNYCQYKNPSKIMYNFAIKFEHKKLAEKDLFNLSSSHAKKSFSGSDFFHELQGLSLSIYFILSNYTYDTST